MNIYIFLRRTEDWANVSLNECKRKSDGSSRDRKHLSILHQWNSEFSMTWQMYRFYLQKKAFESWGSIPILHNKNDVISKNDEDVIIPIDDDDWLHPDIVPFIQSEIKNNTVLQWTQILNAYDISNRYINKWGLTDYQRKAVHGTSDHCLRIGYLKKLNTQELNTSLLGHGHVWRAFLHTRRQYVPETMSCYNHHMGSYSFLINTNNLNDCKKRVEFINSIPEWSLWAESNIHWLDKLSHQVIQKDIIKYF